MRRTLAKEALYSSDGFYLHSESYDPDHIHDWDMLEKYVKLKTRQTQLKLLEEYETKKEK